MNDSSGPDHEPSKKKRKGGEEEGKKKRKVKRKSRYNFQLLVDQLYTLYTYSCGWQFFVDFYIHLG